MLGRCPLEVNRALLAAALHDGILLGPKPRKETAVKVGDVYTCEDCGAEFTVTKACDCGDFRLRCCDKPQAQGQRAGRFSGRLLQLLADPKPLARPAVRPVVLFTRA